MSSYSLLLKKLLKDKFGIKFSVTRPHGMTYYVKYTDGVPEREVEKFVSQFEFGHFDGMTDTYISTNPNGFASYILVFRKMSDKAREKIIEEIKRNYGNDILNMDPEGQRIRLGMDLNTLINRMFDSRSFLD